MMGAALLLMLVINDGILKNLIARPRPFNRLIRPIPLCSRFGRFSLPRDCEPAVQLFLPLGAYLIFFRGSTAHAETDKKIGIPALVLAFLIGFSRIYVHVHYPTDVIVGAIAGLFYGWVGIVLVQKLEPIVKRWWAQRKARKAA